MPEAVARLVRPTAIWLGFYLSLGLVIGLFTLPVRRPLPDLAVHLASALILTICVAAPATLPGLLRRGTQQVAPMEAARLSFFSALGAGVGGAVGLWLVYGAGVLPVRALEPLPRAAGDLAWASIGLGFFAPVCLMAIGISAGGIIAYNRRLRDLPPVVSVPTQVPAAGASFQLPGLDPEFRMQLDALFYLTADRNRTILHGREGDRAVHLSLSALLRMLPPGRFVRVHRKHAVRFDLVASVEHFLGGTYVVRLSDDDETTLPVGRTFRPELVRLLASP